MLLDWAKNRKVSSYDLGVNKVFGKLSSLPSEDQDAVFINYKANYDKGYSPEDAYAKAIEDLSTKKSNAFQEENRKTSETRLGEDISQAESNVRRKVDPLVNPELLSQAISGLETTQSRGLADIQRSRDASSLAQAIEGYKSGVEEVYNKSAQDKETEESIANFFLKFLGMGIGNAQSNSLLKSKQSFSSNIDSINNDLTKAISGKQNSYLDDYLGLDNLGIGR
jgi:hypothetical protein